MEYVGRRTYVPAQPHVLLQRRSMEEPIDDHNPWCARVTVWGTASQHACRARENFVNLEYIILLYNAQLWFRLIYLLQFLPKIVAVSIIRQQYIVRQARVKPWQSVSLPRRGG